MEVITYRITSKKRNRYALRDKITKSQLNCVKLLQNCFQCSLDNIGKHHQKLKNSSYLIFKF